MYLAHVMLEMSSIHPPGTLRAAMNSCVAGAVQADPGVVAREQKRFPPEKLMLSNAQDVLEQQSKENTAAAISGLFSLRQTPMKKELFQKEWKNADDMTGALLLSHFASSPAKGLPDDEGARAVSSGRDLNFSVYQDGGVEGSYTSNFPPPQPRGAARSEAGRWTCGFEGCNEIFATRDLLRAHSKATGHPAAGEKPPSCPGSASKRKQGLAEQPQNLQPLYVTSAADRAGKRLAYCQAADATQV